MSGLIDGNRNMLTAYCQTSDKMAPYFHDWEKFAAENELTGKVDKYLFNRLDSLSSTDIVYGAAGADMDNNEDVAALPDAVYRVKEANERSLKYDVAVSDHKQREYHKLTGLTKIRVNASEPRSTMLRGVEGQVEAASLINKAYMRELHDNLFVTTGLNYYPFKRSVAETAMAKYVDNVML